MPILIAALIGGLWQAAFSIVGRVLIALGISYVTYQGVDASLTWTKGMIAANVGALPAQALAVMSALRLGSFVSVILSAVAARLLFDGMTGGAVKKMVLK